MFGTKKTVNKDFGLTACQTCTDTHTPSCTKIDEQLAKMLEIGPKDPDRAAKLKRAKQMHFDKR